MQDDCGEVKSLPPQNIKTFRICLLHKWRTEVTSGHNREQKTNMAKERITKGKSRKESQNDGRNKSPKENGEDEDGGELV
eukprot:3126909-Pleurochrysis_carterae.AAC.1